MRAIEYHNNKSISRKLTSLRGLLHTKNTLPQTPARLEGAWFLKHIWSSSLSRLESHARCASTFTPFHHWNPSERFNMRWSAAHTVSPSTNYRDLMPAARQLKHSAMRECHRDPGYRSHLCLYEACSQIRPRFTWQTAKARLTYACATLYRQWFTNVQSSCAAAD